MHHLSRNIRSNKLVTKQFTRSILTTSTRSAGHSVDELAASFRGYYVHKNLLTPNPKLKQTKDVKGKTAFISGGSRGIGLDIAKKLCAAGANVVLAAKTVEPQKNLPGTIFTAAKECEELGGGKALPIQMDLRNEENVQAAYDKTIEEFGSLDILVNNASAIHIESSETIDMKRYDLMHSINGRGTFLATKLAIPHLKKGENSHVLTLAPPLDATLSVPNWFKLTGTAYITAKLQMSLQVVGMSAELREHGIGCNGLWPRTTIATAAVKNMLGGQEMIDKSRTPEIMGDAAHAIFCSDSTKNTGNFWVDDEVLVNVGVRDLSKYRVNQDTPEHELIPDFFV
jgi:citronellol/citronellal dehydrogenase